ncbi:MAG: hypothetical protein PHR24_01380 [Oscillospiraceae bacterium]|nr:hypothetical protein [Oscillospiraceae bacterium]
MSTHKKRKGVKQLKRRLIALFASGVMMFCFLSFTASAEVVSRVPSTGVLSPYPDYAEGASNSGSGKISVRATGLLGVFYIEVFRTDAPHILYVETCTTGTDTMAQIGIKNLRLQRWANNEWQTITSYTSLAKNTGMHSFWYISPTLQSGYFYRFVGDHYAKEQGWFFPKSQTIQNITDYLYIN